MNAFLSLVRRDLLLVSRSRAEALNPLFFFVLVISLFPLGVGPEGALLATMAPGVVWVAALLAALLALDGMFRSDFEDGSLEQMLISSASPALLVLAKCIAHWVSTGLPVLLFAPLAGLFLNLPTSALPALMLSLLLGTPILSAVGSIGIALTVGLRRGGMLLILLVLPLYVPILIFGAGAVDAAVQGLSFSGQLAMLGALFIVALLLAPVAAAAALRISVN